MSHGNIAWPAERKSPCFGTFKSGPILLLQSVYSIYLLNNERAISCVRTDAWQRYAISNTDDNSCSLLSKNYGT